MDNTQKIIDLLKEQVVAQTLSFQGIEQVQAILTENENLEEKLKKAKAQEIFLNERLTEHRHEISELLDEVKKYKPLAEKLEADEKAFYENSIKFEYEQQRGNELKEIIGMALRNPVVTKARSTIGSDNAYDPSTGMNKTITKDLHDTTTETIG